MEVSTPTRCCSPTTGSPRARWSSTTRLWPRSWSARRGPASHPRAVPHGIGQQGFFQKHAADYFPESIGRVVVPKEGGTVEHPVVDDGEGLAYLANQGTLTFHVWTSRVPTLDRPDRMIFDLDPPKGDVVAAAGQHGRSAPSSKNCGSWDSR